ncbi:MAG TPA: hypothetical protein VGO62_00190 [Myxococcota bacterium]|jgi:hypothetical protein
MTPRAAVVLGTVAALLSSSSCAVFARSVKSASPLAERTVPSSLTDLRARAAQRGCTETAPAVFLCTRGSPEPSLRAIVVADAEAEASVHLRVLDVQTRTFTSRPARDRVEAADPALRGEDADGWLSCDQCTGTAELVLATLAGEQPR